MAQLACEHGPLVPSEVLDLSQVSTKPANRCRLIWGTGREEKKGLSLLTTSLPCVLPFLTVSPWFQGELIRVAWSEMPAAAPEHLPDPGADRAGGLHPKRLISTATEHG